MTEKPKKQNLREGDVFFVPLVDGSQCVGQVLKVTKLALNSCVCAFFDIRSPANEIKVKLNLNEEELIAVQFVTPDLIKGGYWPIVENRRVSIDIERYIALRRLEKDGFVGAKVVGSGNIQEFLSAFYGLRPWDTWHDPNYLDKLLVSPNRRPANVILTKT